MEPLINAAVGLGGIAVAILTLLVHKQAMKLQATQFRMQLDTFVQFRRQTGMVEAFAILRDPDIKAARNRLKETPTPMPTPVPEEFEADLYLVITAFDAVGHLFDDDPVGCKRAAMVWKPTLVAIDRRFREWILSKEDETGEKRFQGYRSLSDQVRNANNPRAS